MAKGDSDLDPKATDSTRGHKVRQWKAAEGASLHKKHAVGTALAKSGSASDPASSLPEEFNDLVREMKATALSFLDAQENGERKKDRAARASAVRFRIKTIDARHHRWSTGAQSPEGHKPEKSTPEVLISGDGLIIKSDPRLYGPIQLSRPLLGRLKADAELRSAFTGALEKSLKRDSVERVFEKRTQQIKPEWLAIALRCAAANEIDEEVLQKFLVHHEYILWLKDLFDEDINYIGSLNLTDSALRDIKKSYKSSLRSHNNLLDTIVAKILKSPDKGGALEKTTTAKVNWNAKALRDLCKNYPHDNSDFGDLTIEQVENDRPDIARALWNYVGRNRLPITAILPASPERRGRKLKYEIDRASLNPANPVDAMALALDDKLAADRARKARSKSQIKILGK